MSRTLYAPEKLHAYPHMLSADVILWEKWLDRYHDFFTAVEYDVHIGGAVERMSHWTQDIIEMASTLAAKRIDVVGHRPGETWIIEVKPDAGTTAIGQLVAYKILYAERFSPVGKIECALVTNNLILDEKFLLERLGFKWFVV